jgi:hypothetical protein
MKIEKASNPPVEIRDLTDEELDRVAGAGGRHFYRPLSFPVRQTIGAMIDGAQGSATLPR